MQNVYASDELFHFVGHSSPTNDSKNYKNLKNVLSSNCISYPPHDGTWGNISYTATWDNNLETEQLIVPTVTCYADIPFKSLSIHTNKYGKFGIALPKSLLTKYGARPVTYIPMRSDDWKSIHGLMLLRNIETITKDLKTSIEEKLGNESSVSATHDMLLKDFLAFIKPFNSELPDDHPNNYYMEREWRKYGNMKFEPAQVTKILVAQGFKTQAENDYPEYRDRIFEV